MTVRCERDGTVFQAEIARHRHWDEATDTDVMSDMIQCPTCKRVYIKVEENFISDRKLTILKS